MFVTAHTNVMFQIHLAVALLLITLSFVFSKITSLKRADYYCETEYKNGETIDLFYIFDLKKFSSIDNTLQGKFHMEKCEATRQNIYCEHWQSSAKYENICEVIGTVVKCKPPYILGNDNNYRFVAKYNNYSFITPDMQYNAYDTRCFCGKGYLFNPKVNVSTDPYLGRAFLKMKPYQYTPPHRIVSYFRGNIYREDGKILTIVKEDLISLNGYYQFYVDLDICFSYNFTAELVTSDCSKRNMDFVSIKFNVSNLVVPVNLSCWENETHFNMENVNLKNSQLYFQAHLNQIVYNFSTDANFAIMKPSNDFSKKAFYVSLCATRCGLCGPNYTLVCASNLTNSEGIYKEKDLSVNLSKNGIISVVVTILSIVVLILIILGIIMKSRKRNLDQQEPISLRNEVESNEEPLYTEIENVYAKPNVTITEEDDNSGSDNDSNFDNVM